MESVNLAKWNIYAVALQDLTLFTFSKLKANFNYQDIEKAKEIFLKILDDEISNKMPIDIIENAKKSSMKDYKISIGTIIIMIYHLIPVLCHYISGHLLQKI